MPVLLAICLILGAVLIITKNGRTEICNAGIVPPKKLFSSSVLIFLTAFLQFGVSWAYRFYGVWQDNTFSLHIVTGIDKQVVLSFLGETLLPTVALSVATLCLARLCARFCRASGAYFLFSVVYAAVSVSTCFAILAQVTFQNIEALGYLLVSVEKGIAFPERPTALLIAAAVLLTAIVFLLARIFSLGIQPEPALIRSKASGAFRIVGTALSLLLLLSAVVLSFAAVWAVNTFGTISAEQLFFQLRVPLKGTNNDFFVSLFWQCILPSVFVCTVVLLCIYPLLRVNTQYNVHVCSIKKKIRIPVKRWGTTLLICVCSVGVLVISMLDFSNTIGLQSYLKSMKEGADFIDENYVDPRSVQMTFPEKKRNLIYIFMESMENTFTSTELGGAQTRNLIPELTEIAEDNISFSNTNAFGGAIPVSGTTWTIAAMTGQHMGIPLRLPIEGNSYDQFASFIPGGYSLGDVLEEQGYNQTLLVGSDAEFGGRKAFYTQHGNYKVLDLYTAWEDKIVPNGRSVWWGFEDVYLYEYAKKELEALSAQEEPFNLTMLTVDTHHIGGYRCSLCKNEAQSQYWDVISCASRQLDRFLKWLETQPYYENTTVVISGDHPSMDPIVPQQMPSGYQRTLFNAFIQSAVQTKHTKNRLFSPMDMLPSTLAAMGVEIEGNRLCLGVNLFSEEPTLLEEYGVDAVNSGLNGYSKLYDELLTEGKK